MNTNRALLVEAPPGMPLACSLDRRGCLALAIKEQIKKREEKPEAGIFVCVGTGNRVAFPGDLPGGSDRAAFSGDLSGQVDFPGNLPGRAEL